MMPPSDDDDDDDEEVGKQSKNAGMMPPSDDSDDDDDDDDDSEDDGPTEIERLKKIFAKCEVPKEIRRDLGFALLAWKKDHDIRPLNPAAPPKAKTKAEDEEPAVVDPKVAKKLEEVRKRREAQAKQRIEKEGWDRFAPMSETNKPPGTTWPPPGGASAAAEIS